MPDRPPRSREIHRLLGAAALLGLFVTTPALAQNSSSTSYTIGANAGLVVPVSDLSNYTSSGYTIAATLGMHPPLSPIGLRVEGSYTELPFSDNSGLKHRIYGFSLDGLYNIGTASTNGGLYLTGGLGYFGWKETGGIFDTGTAWDFGLNAGLGYYLPLSGFTVYFEGRYRNIFASTSQAMFPITVGIAF
jgi:hypothetical protein